MPPPQLDDLFTPGADVLGTRQNEKGTILAQTGDVVGEEAHSDNAEWWQHVGFASRPAKAVAGKSACQVITINQGSNDICIASRDLRGSSLYGTLRDGETCVYAPGPTNQGTGRILLQDDGSGAIITITAGATTIVINGSSVSVNGTQVNIGNGASDPVALAPAHATRAAAQDLFNAAVITALGKPGPNTGVIPAVPALASSAASTTVKASQ